VEKVGATHWTEGTVTYTIDIYGDKILVSQIGTPMSFKKTDKPGQLSSISLDGINYWRHGDIVYVQPIYDNMQVEKVDANGDILPKTIVSKAYRRISALASGQSSEIA